jgi:glucosamine-6-phosphate deaminase
MKILKVNNYKTISEKASEIIINEIKKKPNSIIAFATGKTPLGLYKILTNASKKNKVDFSKIKAFNLDEYYPIKQIDKRSFDYFLFKNLFDKINLKKENINILNGETKNPKKECENYEEKLRKNKVDIMILGVGQNGHIAFNEPGSQHNSKTRLVKLSKETIKANSTILNKIPKEALTIGISTILSTKKIILLASGKNKAEAIRQLIKEKQDKRCPVTFLKKHKDLIVIVDEDSGCLLD